MDGTRPDRQAASTSPPSSAPRQAGNNAPRPPLPPLCTEFVGEGSRCERNPNPTTTISAFHAFISATLPPSFSLYVQRLQHRPGPSPPPPPHDPSSSILSNTASTFPSIVFCFYLLSPVSTAAFISTTYLLFKATLYQLCHHYFATFIINIIIITYSLHHVSSFFLSSLNVHLLMYRAPPSLPSSSTPIFITTYRHLLYSLCVHHHLQHRSPPPPPPPPPTHLHQHYQHCIFITFPTHYHLRPFLLHQHPLLLNTTTKPPPLISHLPPVPLLTMHHITIISPPYFPPSIIFTTNTTTTTPLTPPPCHLPCITGLSTLHSITRNFHRPLTTTASLISAKAMGVRGRGRGAREGGTLVFKPWMIIRECWASHRGSLG